jgi:hypothetical protein
MIEIVNEVKIIDDSTAEKVVAESINTLRCSPYGGHLAVGCEK